MNMSTEPELIFLPGASGSTDFWQPVLQKLSFKHKHVIAYPSFGAYPEQENIKSFSTLQQYVLRQIPQNAVVIAQSMGGIFAVQAALQMPEKIRALILVATSGGIDLSRFDVKDWREEYKNTFQVPDWFVEHTEYLDEKLHEIKCPILLIWGDSDPISPVAVAVYLQQKLAHAELVVIEQGQHDLAYEYADQVSVHIAHFLQQNLKAER
ncbi:alpha/beta fold hydrolase [Acinetobacter gerneri]|uniref:alpha/beta fold hydrolase n=1 Tax=Acinetobacter gerneri TaxID=202952 RepID=UPI003AF7E9CF